MLADLEKFLFERHFILGNESVSEYFFDPGYRDDGDHIGVPFLNEDIRKVRLRDDDRMDPGLCGSLDFVGDAADRENISTDRK